MPFPIVLYFRTIKWKKLEKPLTWDFFSDLQDFEFHNLIFEGETGCAVK